MIYLAQFRFGTRLEMIGGEFSYLVEASSQEEAELKLTDLLQEAVKNEEWFPAPCRILLARMAVMDAIPSPGLVFHHRTRKCGEFDFDHFPMKYLPTNGVRVLFDLDNWDYSKRKDIPVPLFFVERDRSLSFPTENVPPALW